jgi:hypothetical protein
MINKNFDTELGAKAKLKINIKIIDYPGLRSIEESSKGRTAGEVNRLYAFGHVYPYRTCN